MASPRKGRRRLGALSDEDRALWQQVAATAVPLAGSVSRQAMAAGQDDPAPPVMEMPETPRSVLSTRPERSGSGPRVSVTHAPRVGEIGLPEPGLDRNTARRIRRGDRAPEARIDLHGMSAARAHAACLNFLADALARGLRFVLVITGKGGRRDPDTFMDRPGGVIREQLPGWLAASPLGREVVGIYQAHQRHGGSGAYYVYLKRRR